MRTNNSLAEMNLQSVNFYFLLYGGTPTKHNVPFEEILSYAHSILDVEPVFSIILLIPSS